MADLLDPKLTEDQVKSASVQDIAQGFHKLVQMVQDDKKRVDEGLKSAIEAKTDFETRITNLNKAVNNLETRYPEVPHTDREEKYAARPGGLFSKNKPTLQPIELLALSPHADCVRGTDKELLMDFHDAWDASTFKSLIETCKAGAAPNAFEVGVEKATRGVDFQRLQNCVKFMGYEPEKVINAKGYTKAEDFKKTLIHPESGGIVNPLTFTVVSAAVIDMARLQLRVADKFVQIPLQHTNQKLPVNRGDAIGVRGGAATTDPPPTATITTSIPNIAMFGNISFGTADFDVESVMAFLWWQDRAVMESAVPLLPYLRSQIAFAHARAVDRACMSGDIQGRDGTSHMDDWADNFGTRDCRTLWNGLRRIGANYMTDNAAGTYDSDDLKAQKKRMGVYGVSPQNMVLWLPPGPIHDFMQDPDVRTINVFGPSATVKTGVLAECDGVQIALTEWIPTDLSGVTGFSANGGTATAAVLADVTRYGLGQLGIVGVETTRIAPMLTTIIQATGFMDFVPFEAVDGNGIFAAGSKVPVDILFDVAP